MLYFVSMKCPIIITSILFFSSICSAQQSTNAIKLVTAAKNLTVSETIYDGKYIVLHYPGGDVPKTIGVCTDVIVRSFRNAFNIDLQKLVHEDMKIAGINTKTYRPGEKLSVYPDHWGHKKPDKNIDHRRVPNLETFFSRSSNFIPIAYNGIKPGDIVTYRLNEHAPLGFPHIGIVSDEFDETAKTYKVIHHNGTKTEKLNGKYVTTSYSYVSHDAFLHQSIIKYIFRYTGN